MPESYANDVKQLGMRSQLLAVVSAAMAAVVHRSTAGLSERAGEDATR